MKYSSRNSSIKNSLNIYNQISMMSIILCKEYIAKSFISRNGKIAVKWEFLKVQVAVTADTDGYRPMLTLIMTLDSTKYYFYAQ